jgi:hypothetical protein
LCWAGAQLEPVVVLGRRRALQDGAALQHLHADVALVLHGLRHEHVVKRVEHLAFACGRDVHFDIEPDVFRPCANGGGQAAEPERSGGGHDRGP